MQNSYHEQRISRGLSHVHIPQRMAQRPTLRCASPDHARAPRDEAVAARAASPAVDSAVRHWHGAIVAGPLRPSAQVTLRAGLRYRPTRKMPETITDVFPGAKRRLVARPRPALYFAFQTNDAEAAPSRHLLDDTEIVCFGRGPRSAERREIRGKPGLAIQVPDPVMSTDHGCLVKTDDAWRLEDPASKNGALVNGRPTRLTRIEAGAVIQLGHTIFLFEHVRDTDGAARDTMAAPIAPPLSELVTLDPRLAASIAELKHLAVSDVPILVLGETGTGKEVVARAIHALSRRRGELVAVNCGAIPATLIESELFGHKKGSFSGCVTDRLGHLRAADNGTLFLDEVGELPLPAQVALLRALQQREVVPVGESLPVPVNLRVVAATHRDLPSMIDEGRFRQDLYGRLLGVKLTLPPLRDRRFDLGIVIATLLRRLDRSGSTRITPIAARALFAYAWPRNIRELERVLESALARSTDGTIDLDQLPDEIAESSEIVDAAGAEHEASAPATAEDNQLRAELVDALVRHDGNVTAAARELGKRREQIHRWARRLGIDLDSFRR